MPTSRFEYRIFASSLEAVRPDLEADLDRVDTEAEISAEIYLLGTRKDRNVKIRDDAVGIKALRERRDRLERWEPLLRIPFPLRGISVRETLAPALGVAELHAPRASYDAVTLLDEVVAASPALREVPVHKTRERFAGRDVLAEFARIRVRGAPVGASVVEAEVDEGEAQTVTVAVESEDPEVVTSWVHRLGLDHWPNESYVRWLRRVPEAEVPALAGRSVAR